MRRFAQRFGIWPSVLAHTQKYLAPHACQSSEMLVLGGEEGKGSGMESDDNVCGRNCLYIEGIAFPSLSFVFVSISEIKVDNQHRTLVEMRLGIYCVHITHTQLTARQSTNSSRQSSQRDPFSALTTPLRLIN